MCQNELLALFVGWPLAIQLHFKPIQNLGPTQIPGDSFFVRPNNPVPLSKHLVQSGRGDGFLVVAPWGRCHGDESAAAKWRSILLSFLPLVARESSFPTQLYQETCILLQNLHKRCLDTNLMNSALP